jgi:glutamate dehydrogenase
MITSDPARRAQILDDVTTHLDRRADPADRERLLAFAGVAFAETPDTLALRLPPPALAERLFSHYEFVAKTMPPGHQLYRGLPGIHVAVRNPSDEEAAATGSASGHYHEVTIVELHTPDAPFIFESLKNFFQKEGLRVFSAIHPIFTVRRQWEQIVWIGGPGDDGSRELYCQFRIERVDARERLRRLEHQIHSLLKSVFLAVEDHGEMQRALRDLIPRLRPRPEAASSLETVKAFIAWILDDNYVHLGQLHFTRGKGGQLHAEPERAFGVFKDPQLIPTVFPGLVERMNSYLTVAPGEWRIIDLDYPTNISAIHHLEPIDDILIREWAEDGALAAGTLVVGRLSKSALTTRAQDIPILDHKLRSLLEKSGALPNSHTYREIRSVFNHFPKRELLYADSAALKEIIDRMVYMAGDDEIAVSTRKGRGYVALAIAFADRRYSPRAEEELKTALAGAFGPISFNTWADCGTNGVLIYYFDESSLERPVETALVRELTRKVITTWEDQTALALEYAFGPIDGRRLFKKYVRSESRSGLYRESTRPEEVPDDLRCLEQLEGRLEMAVIPGTAERATIKLFAPRPLTLTATLRTLQNFMLGVTEEISFPLTLPEGRAGFLSRLVVEAQPGIIAAMLEGRGPLLDALRALHEERGTDCPLNGLVLLVGLGWRDVEMLRTLRNHLLQLRPHYNADTVNGVLLRNADAARALFDDFAARFDPAREADRADGIDRADTAVRRALKRVSSLLDDEILRGLQNLVHATVRTNFYQHPERPVFSIKVESARVEGMVSPRPLFEIYVHARALEGIHLRGGKVARGGIRWSDRHDDFRTEVLGLMKTQMVKNSIIVPVGSKGGFVLKGAVPPRPALDQYLIMRYRQFISGLLDVTDNLVNGEVVHPPQVVRHDGPDPYLVVAADKGTAHLSDTANQVSAQYGFWLGDAFASGGSVGYDHKREGITARGAWECVRHHFRTLGVDVQTEPFTMAGIGDMSGDVFGNGALRSRATKLVAAFDHRHVFLDPAPDPERSFVERERLFGLPRSSWRDYDAALISEGGGVFDRTAKSIPLSPQIQALLDMSEAEASGEEVIRRILRANVDLLYNGGIGTYVKASGEIDAEVGDRANDRVRVDAGQVRARVVAEGGNLGVTQPGRIEYWMHGGLINTDAVDNSGGVDMSDHEVNIKILLDLLVRSGVIADRDARNRLLAEMTDEVSELVLADNRQQALALTLDGARSAANYEDFVALVDDLVAAGIVNRADAAIPGRDELLASEAKARGLPRPVIAVLLGHVKNWAFEQVLTTEVPDGPLGLPFLERYFPAQLRDRHAEHFPKHPLKREIVATAAVNHLVNHAGIAFIHRMAAATGAAVGEVIEAYLEADRESGSQAARAELLAAGRRIHDELAGLLDIETRLAQAVRDRLAGGAPAGSGAATRRGKL